MMDWPSFFWGCVVASMVWNMGFYFIMRARDDDG
jgi:hypothetical protein